jgi:hypothetical protein
LGIHTSDNLEYEVGSYRLDGSCSSSGGETSWKVGVLAVQDRAILAEHSQE